MRLPGDNSRAPVTADDLEQAVRLAVDTLVAAPAADWDAKAGSLDWTCWETVEHLADDLFGYAVQLGLRTPPENGYVPFRWEARRPGGPRNGVHADPDAGPAGLLRVLESCGSLLVAMVRTTPPHVRSWHNWGHADPEGFAAMGLVETLVHTHDVAGTLGVAWQPPSELCARALHRLFPDAPADAPPWPVLLWATGRADLPGRPRPTEWRWHGEPRP
ncbi:hypothetical protein ACSNOI_43435 [Actinomadura kijaniata]|uniref:hypothetical protein n=1 Tax=Actinomadura kijaniata TaxID=46161 RepID=UPI003F1DF929